MSNKNNKLSEIIEKLRKYILASFDNSNFYYFNKFFSWLKLHFRFHFKNTITTKFKKYEIYWIHFGVNIGTEFGEKRPGVIFKSNKYIRGKDIIVLPITSFKKEKKYSDLDIIINKTLNNNLKLDSVIKLEHIKSISKMRIGDYIGELDSEYIKIVENKIIKMILK